RPWRDNRPAGRSPRRRRRRTRSRPVPRRPPRLRSRRHLGDQRRRNHHLVHPRRTGQPSVTAPGTASPTRPWTPPLSGGELATVLNRLHDWNPFDGGALLDDVAVVLDDVPPAE